MSLANITCNRDFRAWCKQGLFDFCQLVCAVHNMIMSIYANNNTGTFWLAMIGSKKTSQVAKECKLTTYYFTVTFHVNDARTCLQAAQGPNNVVNF